MKLSSSKTICRAILRILVISLVVYLLYSTVIAIYNILPLAPSSTIFGFIFQEPQVQISIAKLLLSVMGVLSITVVPILFVWAKVEDHYFIAE